MFRNGKKKDTLSLIEQLHFKKDCFEKKAIEKIISDEDDGMRSERTQRTTDAVPSIWNNDER